LQEQASNHLKLLWSKAMVVSVKGKAWRRPCQIADEIQNRLVSSKNVAEYVFKCLSDYDFSPLRALGASHIEPVVPNCAHKKKGLLDPGNPLDCYG
jgi:hypothetical protein